jgi:hypothetical protein
MFRLFQKRSASSRDALLKAVPVKNELVREKVIAEAGGLRLTAPLRPNRLRKSLSPASGAEKTFELDALGAYVWKQIDGRSVEQLIEVFAATHRVNVREAEVSVTAFLHTLVRRNLVALVAPK